MFYPTTYYMQLKKNIESVNFFDFTPTFASLEERSVRYIQVTSIHLLFNTPYLKFNNLIWKG